MHYRFIRLEGSAFSRDGNVAQHNRYTGKYEEHRGVNSLLETRIASSKRVENRRDLSRIFYYAWRLPEVNQLFVAWWRWHLTALLYKKGKNLYFQLHIKWLIYFLILHHENWSCTVLYEGLKVGTHKLNVLCLYIAY